MIKGSKMTLEQRKRLSDAHKGQIVTEETKKKIAKTHKERNMAQRLINHIKENGVWNKGKKGVQKPAEDDKSPNWKGEKCGYQALHTWVRKHLGKASKCSFCGKTGGSSQQYNWANIDHKYRRNTDDFIELCCGCHRKYDNNLRKP